jgi:hypothetical protein
MKPKLEGIGNKSRKPGPGEEGNGGPVSRRREKGLDSGHPSGIDSQECGDKLNREKDEEKGLWEIAN